MLHPQAATGFGRGADAYERGRPGYPDAAIGWLAEELRLGPGSVVVDLAAGTGKLTRLLVPTGARVIATEPIEAMREVLAATVDGVEVVAGTAEAIPLPDGFADGITVAQALHWFDFDRALPQIHQVLRRSGRLAVVYNHRDLDQPLFREVSRIIEPYRGATPDELHSGSVARLAASPLFTPAAERGFPNRQRLTVPAFVDRVTSTSFISALPEHARRQVEAELRALVAGVPEPISLRYHTTISLFDPV
jgi:SAM-dependent methyltransferase